MITRLKFKIPATLEVGGLKELQEVDMQFDLVATNPPYNSPKGNGSHPLYRLFIEDAINRCSKNGTVAIITPPGFLNSSDALVSSKVFSLIKTGNLSHVQLEGVNDKFPGIGTPICYFIWDNKPYQGKTTIDDTDYDISEVVFVPRIFNALSMSIIQKMIQGDVLQFNYRLKNDDTKWRVCFKELNHISNKKGNVVPTIFSPNKATDFCFVRECSSKDEALVIRDYLSSKLVSFFNFVTRYNSVFHNRMIGRIRFPNLTRTWTDQELYAHFNLTEEEINYIEEQVK